MLYEGIISLRRYRKKNVSPDGRQISSGEDREDVQDAVQSLNQVSKHVPPAELRIGRAAISPERKLWVLRSHLTF
jgi:hypothetical protein